ncbi:MAG: barstar family protein [Megasphaera sp.]|jgi:hypothetical protein|nr:barstar family protein [Megasphaera sp.]
MDIIKLNQVLIMNSEEFKGEKKSLYEYEKKDIFIADINGNFIQSEDDFIEQTQNIFRFPSDCHNNWDGYIDWMTDLDWLHKKGYVLIIRNFTQLLSRNIIAKRNIMDILIGNVLPFWQWEIERCIVDGKRKPFILILVD